MSQPHDKPQASPEAIAIDKQEWQESIDYIHREFGESGVREILRAVQDRIISAGINLNEATLNTPYINTIPPSEQPAYPGDIALEKKIENINRWNAMAMVLQGADSGLGVGGHIATYASAATVMEVGYNHFFRKRSDTYGGEFSDDPTPRGTGHLRSRLSRRAAVRRATAKLPPPTPAQWWA
ncbi:MAG: hypothetical protein KUG81_00465 [Gammaproteobacteria bacterium]|nr:hypothetical protein [Gammaproteobacteria bacterium]